MLGAPRRDPRTGSIQEEPLQELLEEESAPGTSADQTSQRPSIAGSEAGDTKDGTKKKKFWKRKSKETLKVDNDPNASTPEGGLD